jgi:LPXTG-site transpeptidase (sortase) family protein
MKRALLAIEIALIGVTAVLMGYVGYVWRSAYYTQARGHVLINRPKEHERLTPVEGSLLGQIEIPRIGLSSIILEGTEASTLRRAVGHIRGTALPGQPGNLCIAGHRDTFFRPLRRVAAGDDIIVETATGRVTYRVLSTRIVDPEDVEVLDNTPADAVTLVTCYPFHFIGTAPKRFVVRAVRIEGERRDGGTDSRQKVRRLS